MTVEQTAQLLALIQTFEPRREVGDATILAWHEIIGSLDFQEAAAAIRDYYSTQTWPVMPAHIVERVDRARAQRDRDERIALGMTRNAIARGEQTVYNHLSEPRFREALLGFHAALANPETRSDAWVAVEEFRAEVVTQVEQRAEESRLAIESLKAARL